VAASFFSQQPGKRRMISGTESCLMATMQQQSAEIYALVAAAIATDGDRVERSLDMLIRDPTDALSDDFIFDGKTAA
jgi:hypothetical protein